MLKATKKSFWMPSMHALNKAGGGGGGGGPVTIYTASPTLTTVDSGNVTTTFRMKLPVTGGSGLTQIRATIKPGTTGGDLTILGLGFGKWDSASVFGNTLAPIVEGKFGGVTGFVAQTTPQTCDWTDVTGIGLASGDSVMVTFCTGTATHCTLSFNSAQPAGTNSYWDTGNSWATQNVDGMGYNALSNYNYGVVSVEMQ
jgi:hypothetical protein